MNEIETKVLELIGESTSSPDVFVDTDAGMAPIRDSINDAIQEIVMLTGSYKRPYWLPLREGQQFYRIRVDGGLGWFTDVWSVTQQRRLEQTDLTRLCIHDPRWMVSTGEPVSYMPIGTDVIGFYPKPADSVNVIEITLVEIPAAYETDTDRIKLRNAFQYAAVHYAVGEYWASRGDAAESQKHMTMYLDALGLKDRYMQQIEQTRSFQTRKENHPNVTG